MKRALIFLVLCAAAFAQSGRLDLPTSKTLQLPAPGAPKRTNAFPGAMAVSHSQRYIAILNNGFGTKESNFDQSIAILDTQTNALKDFPDARFAQRAKQSYFYGLAWSRDDAHLYVSVGSITDPEGTDPKAPGLGNGIAVYSFHDGQLAAERFIKIPLQKAPAGKDTAVLNKNVPKGTMMCYPAGIALVQRDNRDQMVVACNLSDSALLLDIESGDVVKSFDLALHAYVPATYPFGVVANPAEAWVSLWNASRVARLDLASGKVEYVDVSAHESATAPASHPSVLGATFSSGASYLHVVMSNSDEVAAIDTSTRKIVARYSSQLPNQQHLGSFPQAIAFDPHTHRIFVANGATNSVAVFKANIKPLTLCIDCSEREKSEFDAANAFGTPKLLGFIPTEWYPTSLAVAGDYLYVATAKSRGTGPNVGYDPVRKRNLIYAPSLENGSVARINIKTAEENLTALTQEVLRANRMTEKRVPIKFASGATADLAGMAAKPATPKKTAARRPAKASPGNPIKHVIYVIKENRTYDQVFGDMPEANGDPSLTMYGQDITPNQHALARQFGILDNFFDSGEISGSGHVWSTAAITSDYTERIWPINYRGRERTYDFEGDVSNGVPLIQGIPDVNEPGTGYLWTNAARHGVSIRHYGEYIQSHWCNMVVLQQRAPQEGTPLTEGASCGRTYIKPGEMLNGKPSPWGWDIPILAFNQATKPELRGHFDPNYPDFRMEYPDQLRADEFLREFNAHVANRQLGRDTLPQLIVLRLPNDHTAGTRPNSPTPAAAVADNDLAVGRVVDAISHSPYWDDTAILILEDDAQDGADHVDAHRSTALVISKYSPSTPQKPLVVSNFYTTVSMIATLEALLGLPPMNNNDARAPLITELFTGKGTQTAFTADYRNRDNGLIYQANKPNAPGARESAEMDFSHADSADTEKLNAILWRDRMGNRPMPKKP